MHSHPWYGNLNYKLKSTEKKKKIGTGCKILPHLSLTTNVKILFQILKGSPIVTETTRISESSKLNTQILSITSFCSNLIVKLIIFVLNDK